MPPPITITSAMARNIGRGGAPHQRRFVTRFAVLGDAASPGWYRRHVDSEGTDPPFTVADALALPAMQEGTPEVLAGETQLGRAIRWVHSGEYPDMPSVLQGGELLLTHGIYIPSRPEAQRRYIADLSRAGLAGLIIELGTAMQTVPAALIEEAGRQELPLVALHHPVPWVQVSEPVHRAILVRQAALLERGQELQDRFTALLIEGAGVVEVLQALADEVRNPVVLSHEGEPLYVVSRDHQHAAVVSAWETATRALPHASPTLSVAVAASWDAHWGLASVLALDRPLGPFDQVALERAVGVLALGFVQAHAAELVGARDRGEFLDALLDAEVRLDDSQAS